MRDLLDEHRTRLAKWRRAMNLVGPGPLEAHYADSERALDALHEPPTGHWVDLGSGAGFPGIVLAARWPEVRVDLVDSRRKRCVFLMEVLGAAGVERVVVRCTRVEALPSQIYDGVVSRAFARPKVVLEHAMRLLVPGGRVLLMLGGDVPVPAREGFRLVRVERYAIDGSERAVAVLQRT